jgi:hypothetical protein
MQVQHELLTDNTVLQVCDVGCRISSSVTGSVTAVTLTAI